jgi:hypothetical protein
MAGIVGTNPTVYTEAALSMLIAIFRNFRCRPLVDVSGLGYSDGFVCASITSQSRPTLKTKATI